VHDEASIHPTALCDGADLGAGTRVLAYTTVAAGVRVGERCVVGEHVSVGPGCVVETGSVLGSGARLVGDVRVGAAATVGENAVLLAGVTIGRGAVIQAGSSVADPVPANAIVEGNPAVITGYVADDVPVVEGPVTVPEPKGKVVETRVAGVTLHPLTRVTDLRGSLMATDFSDLPFTPQRVFSVLDVPSERIRGSHAHRECGQLLICLQGTISCVVDDGRTRDEIRLEGPDQALHVPPMVWATQYKYSRDAVLLVLASLPYDAADYIRDYDEFLSLAAQRTLDAGMQVR
jgi:UDP-2-acetamido-3-amino-2,3-dideoxy-glucuronate N-acetyltransferase